MKHFIAIQKRIYLFFFIASLILVAKPANLLAQNCFCATEQCEQGLNANFGSQGGPTFCDGQEITLLNTSETGFDFFVIDWSDGAVDTVYDYSNPSHVYTLSEDELCDEPAQIGVCVIGYQECDAGISCHFSFTGFAIRPRPLANFSVDSEVCSASPVNFMDQSCNGEEYLWEFGDGETSTLANPSHTYTAPGDYSITLTVTNGCGTDTAMRDITAVAPPAASISAVADPATGCEPVTLQLSSQSNEYTNLRWNISPFNDSIYCVRQSGVWCIPDTLSNLTDAELEVLFNVPGTYDITLTGANVCGEVMDIYTLEVLETPEISLTAPDVACDEETYTPADFDFQHDGAIDEFNWRFLGGNPTSATGPDFGTVTFSTSGSVILDIVSDCGNLSDTIDITIANTEPISFDDSPSSICQNADPIVLNVSPSGGIWTNLPDGLLDPSMFSVGRHTFTYQLGSVECPNEASITIEILEGVGVELASVEAGCEVLNFVPDVEYMGAIDTYNWTFTNGTPASSMAENPGTVTFNTPGMHPVIIEVNGACGIVSDTIIAEVQANVDIVIEPVDIPLCAGSSPDTLQVNSGGGTWSGDGIIDTQNGVFDPGSVAPDNTYTVTYTVDNGACSANDEIEIEVVSSQAVTVEDETLCEDSAPVNLSADVTGGQWNGTGITDVQVGTFDPASSGIGSFAPTYSFIDANGCEVSAAAEVLVEPYPTLTLTDTIQLCLTSEDIDLAEAFSFVATPNDGSTSWVGEGVTNANPGTFNSGGSGMGARLYSLSVTYTRNACTQTRPVWIDVIESPALELTPNQSVCISDETLQLTANLGGGTWTGPGIDAQGRIDLNTAGDGTFTYRYVYEEGSSCEQEGQTEVEIIDLSQIVQVGGAVELCEGALSSFTFTGQGPAGGTWEGAALTNSATGEVNVSGLVLDSVYIFTYCIESEVVAACGACASTSLVIYSNPVAAFSFDGTPCIGETFSMIDESINAASYDWDFGDNNESTDQSPSHIYTEQGTYTLSLEVTSPQGCTNTTNQELYITTPPTVDFDLTEEEGCAPFEVQVTNNSFGDDITQYWLIAGDTIRALTPADIFLDSITTDSTFAIELVVSNLCGEVRQVDSVLVHPYPLVRFETNVDEGCSPLDISFANTTLGNADTYFWDVGNGQTYTDSLPPVQEYTTTDTTVTIYDILLVASNECGTDSLLEQVTVYPPDVEAFISLDTLDGCQPFTVQLESFSTPGSNISWEVTDTLGNIYTSNIANPTFTLLESGPHTIILGASQCGTDFDTTSLYVLPAPEVSFTHRAYICVGQEIAFQNNSVDVSANEWQFGDGQESTNVSPTHRYDTAGVYEVILTAYSDFNDCPATFRSEVLVIDNPVAAFSPSERSGCAPLTIDFTNESTGLGVLNYSWQFSDGSSASSDENPTHTFSNPGNYPVQLIVSDQDSCFADTAIFNIFVFPDPMSAFQFNAHTYCHRYDTVVLQNQSTNAVAFNWILPDTSFSTMEGQWMPTSPGLQSITLIAESRDGCLDTTTQIVNVLPSPLASLAINDSQGCEDFQVRLTHQNSFTETFSWDLGDGSISTDAVVDYTYAEAGEYLVVLTANNSNGCPSDTAQTIISVWPKPTANFTFDQPFICGAPQEVQFTNNSVGSQDNRWTFGGAGNSDETNPSFNFTDIGTYPIQLLVTNEFGCRDTSVQVIDIYGNPMANFSIDLPIGCEDLMVNLENLSTEALTYSWQVDGQLDSEEVSPTYIFTEPGSYGIQLIATYNEFCQDTLVLADAIQVYESPIADFSYVADESEDIIGDVRFSNHSLLADRYLWDLGDGTSTTVVNPEHEYDINRSIQVTLFAYHDNGGVFTCIDSLQLPVDPEWITTYWVPNSFAPTYGLGDVRLFRPQGVGIEEYEISVYSPWGEQVWHSTALRDKRPTGAWDGYHNGKIAPQGAYAYLARVGFVDGTIRVYKGTVTLLR